MNREEAEIKLRSIFGIDHFYDEQWTAIDRLLKGARILLIDDIYDSGATIKEIGAVLTRLGAAYIAPIVIAKTVGGTL